MYVGGQGGVGIPFRFQNLEGTGLATGTDPGPVQLGSSLLYGGKVGYFFPGIMDWLGIEADVYHETPSFKQHTYTLTQPGGTSTPITEGIHLGLTVMALRVEVRSPDIEGWYGFQPYLGVGPAFFYANTSTGSSSSRDTGLGFSFQAGTRYFMNPAFALFIEYKLDAVTFHFPTALAAGAGFNGDYASHNVAVGISYHFRSF
jgi:opacity protein-like surface antigen